MSLTNSCKFSDADSQFMANALDLARNGLYTAMPNPRVGCVIVRENQIVGSGWHQRAGEPHAEINALAKAGSKAQGATAYVTLEPCSHHGRTGPCVDALINAGIKRVVYAAQDPNPQVCGNGSKSLTDAGIEVVSGLMDAESAALNRGFFKRMKVGQCFVSAKMAMSLDGRTAMQSGESKWITGPQSRSLVQALRAQSCAIVTGVGTVLKDDPALTVRAQELGQKVERQPALVVIDTHLRTPPNSKLLSEAAATQRSVIFACGRKASSKRITALQAQGVVVALFDNTGNDNHIDIAAVLEYLAKQDYNELMLEAGAGLFGQFVQQGLVDELQLFVAAKFLGSAARPLLELPLVAMSEAVELNIVEIAQIGEDVNLRCQFKKARR